MCVDFRNLNTVCLKDLYMLSNINKLINGSLGYKTLNFMDTYSSYNQIKMDPLEAPKKIFMLEKLQLLL